MEIRPHVTDVFKLSHAKRDLFIVVLPGNQQGGQQKTVLTWSIWGHGVFGAQTVSFSMHRGQSGGQFNVLNNVSSRMLWPFFTQNDKALT